MRTPGIILADAMGFLDFQLNPPAMHPDCNLDLIHLTAAPPFLTTMDEVLRAVGNFKSALCGLNQNVKIGLSRRDVVRVRKEYTPGETTAILGLQNTPDDVKVQKLFNAGVRIMQIAYDRINRFGSGSAAATNPPLTDHGRCLLWEMADCGMILDLAHAGHRMAWDVLDYVEKFRLPLKVMVSHTGVWDVYQHCRNLPLAHLQRVALLGGVVGIYSLTFGLDNACNDWLPIARHVEFLRDALSGSPETLCLGTDGIYQHVDPAVQLARFEQLKNKLDPASSSFNARHPVEAQTLNTPNKLQVLSRLLEGRIGATPGIEGENLVNFLTYALPDW